MASPVSSPPLGVARTITALRARVDDWKKDGLSVALVPTMGALHAGHLSLVTHASKIADRTVVSIFVNPTQFAPHEDLDAYPRQERDDLEQLKATGCHLAYTPSAEAMYPAGFQTSVYVDKLSDGLCGASRPHFFGGVATVVCKLLNQCRPTLAIFGEKDYQQLMIIRQMTKDLDMGVEIIGAPIVRDADGLALSSRNKYLSPEERAVAASFPAALSDAAAKLAGGAHIDGVLATARERLLAAGVDEIDYLEVRSAGALSPLGPGPVDQDARLFGAVNVGSTRLIDNLAIGTG